MQRLMMLEHRFLLLQQGNLPPRADFGFFRRLELCWRLSRFQCRRAAVVGLEHRLLLLQRENLSPRADWDFSDAWNYVGDFRVVNADIQQLMSLSIDSFLLQ